MTEPTRDVARRMANAVRMAALMKKRVDHVFTPARIGLGEDGPTHQSVEDLYLHFGVTADRVAQAVRDLLH